jgi:competence protein ComEA
MKHLLKLAVGLLIAYLFFRLLTEYLRPERERFDQEPISVPRHREPPPSTTPAPALELDRLNLNEAGPSALATLPGIGQTLAQRIVARRQEIGSFSRLEDLTQVRGVGRALIERLRPLVALY